MSDPLALFPLAIAAAGGHVDEFEAQQLVAAGLTLKQRSVPLVKALATGRSALLLPASAAWLVALAASDGAGALVVDPHCSDDDIASQLADANVRAVFTLEAMAGRVPDVPTIVLLDDAPARARVVSGVRTVDVDLGSHHGLELEGDQTADGRDEECVLLYLREPGVSRRITLTHRDLLSAAREAAAAIKVDGAPLHAGRAWTGRDGLIRFAAALLAGARVDTSAD